MDVARAIKLDAGDDESITVEILNDVLSNDLSQYNFFWELRKTMNSEPTLSKSSFASVPSSVEFLNYYDRRLIVANFSEDLQAYMETNTTFIDSMVAEYFECMFPILGEPVSAVENSSTSYTLTGTNGIMNIILYPVGSYGLSRIDTTYTLSLDHYVEELLPNAEVEFQSYVDTAMGITPVSGDLVVDVGERTVTILLDEEDTVALYGEYLHYLYARHKITLKKSSIVYGPITFMESFDAEYSPTTYCSVEDVATQLQLLGNDGSRLILTETTQPTRSQVIQFILEAEAEIDARTKDSWKPRQVLDEYHDVPEPLKNMPPPYITVNLFNSHIFPFDTTKGDSVILYSGSSQLEYAELPQSDTTWWVDYNDGIVKLMNTWPYTYAGRDRIKVSYRYGNREVPEDIRQACTMLVGVRLLQSEFNKLYITNQKPNVAWDATTEAWNEKIQMLLSNHRRTIFAAYTR
jgi:hypothetical protein